ncbi:MAG: FHA domain-containing protein [Anaerolineae bacterium]|jgi:hypothetical protein
MKLIVEQGPWAGQELGLDRPTLLIGRGKESDLVLPEQGVSRQHARLQHSPNGWTLIDLGATNGTFVNGQQVPAHEPRLLQPGDRVTIGSSVLALKAREAAPSPGRARPASTAHPLVLAAGAALFVIVLAGIVALLVLLLQPEEDLVTPTPGAGMQDVVTALPVPTQLQDAVGTVAPLIPTGLPLFPSGATATPPPPGTEILHPGGPGLRAGIGP